MLGQCCLVSDISLDRQPTKTHAPGMYYQWCSLWCKAVSACLYTPAKKTGGHYLSIPALDNEATPGRSQCHQCRYLLLQALEAAEHNSLAVLASDPLMHQTTQSLSASGVPSAASAAIKPPAPTAAAMPTSVILAGSNVSKHDRLGAATPSSAGDSNKGSIGPNSTSTEVGSPPASTAYRNPSSTVGAREHTLGLEDRTGGAAAASDSSQSARNAQQDTQTGDLSVGAEPALGEVSNHDSKNSGPSRSKWGQAQQPFRAAGKSSAVAESAASLLQGAAVSKAGKGAGQPELITTIDVLQGTTLDPTLGLCKWHSMWTCTALA